MKRARIFSPEKDDKYLNYGRMNEQRTTALLYSFELFLILFAEPKNSVQNQVKLEQQSISITFQKGLSKVQIGFK